MESHSIHFFCLVSITHCLLFGRPMKWEPPSSSVQGSPQRLRGQAWLSSPRNRTDYLVLLYSLALLCTSVINKHFYGRRFILPYKSKEQRMILRHQYGWALLLCNTMRAWATDLNLRRLQSSHSFWLDGRAHKRLRQDLQQCTANQWDSAEPKLSKQAGRERIISLGLSGMQRAPLRNPNYFLTSEKVGSKYRWQAECAESRALDGEEAYLMVA